MMANSPWRLRTRLMVGLTACLLLTVGFLFVVSNLSGYPQARYPHFTYTWEPGGQVLFTHLGSDSSYRSEPGIAPLYLQLSDGQVLYLPDLSPDIMERVSDVSGLRKATWSIWPEKLAFTDDLSEAKFESGQLRSVTLDSSTQPPLKIARNKDGPFAPLPGTKKELVALFGEPVDWETYHPPTSP